MPAIRQYSSSPRKLPHSSETELYETPVRKRFRAVEDDATPSSSPYSPKSPRKRQRKDSPRKPKKDVQLEQILRDIVTEPTNHTSIQALKTLPRDERSARLLIKDLVHSAKSAVFGRRSPDQALLLETELYVEWLNELEYVVTALETALSTKVPGSRKRLTGFGRTSYVILYNLVDEFIDEVNAHHDGSSSISTEPCLYPATMTLVDEAKDPSTDDRSDDSVQLAEELLRNIDSVFADAVRRYKVECGRNNPTLAAKISAQQHALIKGCCLLCEQTGYGTKEDDMGDTLMEETRDIMQQWRNEYEDCEDQLDDSDGEASSV